MDWGNEMRFRAVLKGLINYLAAELRGIKTASAVVSESFYIHPFCPVTEHRPV